MSILLIKPNDQKAVYGDTLKYTACEPPYWMALTVSYLRNVGRYHDISVIDAEAENLSFEDVAKRVCDINPDIVGVFVVGTNLSASTQKMQGAEKTCQEIKRINKNKRIFLWGLHPSALPEKSLIDSGADYIIKGEGFGTILRLAGTSDNVSSFKDLYFYDSNNRVVYTGVSDLFDTDDLPMPEWDLFPMEKYMPHNWHIMGEDNPGQARGKYGVIQTSVGCPYNCSFCAISAQFGERKVRFWNIDRIVNHIVELVNTYDIRYVKILDECFVLNKSYVNEFCDKLIEKNLDLNIWGYARIDTVNQELLEKLKRAGIRWLAYGIESGDDDILASADKGQFDVEKTKEVIKWTKDAGINIVANFMFGMPDDTFETMGKTLDLAREINPEWINFAVTMPYPGSRDYFTLQSEGKIKNDSWIQYAQYSYECMPMGSKYLSPAEVLKFRDYAFNAFFEGNEEYYKLIRDKFGKKYVDSIKSMTKNPLRRKLLGD